MHLKIYIKYIKFRIVQNNIFVRLEKIDAIKIQNIEVSS